MTLLNILFTRAFCFTGFAFSLLTTEKIVSIWISLTFFIYLHLIDFPDHLSTGESLGWLTYAASGLFGFPPFAGSCFFSSDFFPWLFPGPLSDFILAPESQTGWQTVFGFTTSPADNTCSPSYQGSFRCFYKKQLCGCSNLTNWMQPFSWCVHWNWEMSDISGNGHNSGFLTSHTPFTSNKLTHWSVYRFRYMNR